MVDTFYRHALKKHESQDYIICNENNIVLCDGCSSSPLTEVGSRIIAHIALEEISKIDQLIYSPYTIIRKAEKVIKDLSLPETCLDCTLVTLRKRDYYLANFFGDGTFAWETDKVYTQKMEYTDNAPFYISYYLNSEREQAWRAKGQKYLINGSPINGNCCHWECTGKKVAIFSDGIDSFDENMVESVFDIKTSKGKFLKRRCNHITNDHWDDFSVGMFYEA